MTKVTIEGDVIYTQEINNFQASQIIGYLNNEENVALHVGSGQPVPPLSITPTPATNKTPRDFLIEAQPKTNPQKIAVFVHYVSSGIGKTEVSTGEVKDVFRKIGEPLPRNFTRDVKEAMRANYIYSENGNYVLTERGREAIDNKFTNEVSRKQKRNGSISGRATSKKVVSEEVTKLNIRPDLSGFPEYHALQTKAQKILWILIFADKNNVGSLKPADVEYVAMRLKDKITTQAFSALNASNVKSSFVTTTGDGGFQILQKGLDFLASTGSGDGSDTQKLII